jgi:hypothetical protein
MALPPIKDWFSLKDPGMPRRPRRSDLLDPQTLDWRDRLAAWLTPKEKLQAEIKHYQRRLNALMTARDEALSNAFLFENEDITRWLQNIASTSKGALGVRIKELEEANKELTKRLAEVGPSERKAWQTVDAIIEAWEQASGVKTANWDRKKEEWVPVIRDPMLPQTVIDAIKAWLNRPPA